MQSSAHRNCPTGLAIRRASVIVALLYSANASAGVITDFTWHTGVASVAAEPVVIPPPSQWNQNFPGMSPNPINIFQKNYVAIGPVDLVFTVMNTGGITEYVVNEGVANSTGIAWSGYRLELGFGHGAGFVQATSGDLTFDAPLFDSPIHFPFFPTVVANPYDLTASGGIQPAFAFMGGVKFHIHVPDGITEFTIRQVPIGVPGPSAAIVLLVAACSASRRRHATDQPS